MSPQRRRLLLCASIPLLLGWLLAAVCWDHAEFRIWRERLLGASRSEAVTRVSRRGVVVDPPCSACSGRLSRLEQPVWRYLGFGFYSVVWRSAGRTVYEIGRLEHCRFRVRYRAVETDEITPRPARSASARKAPGPRARP